MNSSIRNGISFAFRFAIDDFKRKYSGSFFGIVWAFIQPISTIFLYWFAFDVVFNNQSVNGIPYIVWLISGLLPWFYFSDAVISSTSCLAEYVYLVKNVVFDIRILPISKIISTFLVQIVLIIISLIITIISGISISLNCLSIIIYLVYLLILSSGIVYFTSSLFVFFKDTIQIISIIFQMVFWFTPIVWQQSLISGKLANVLKFNPLYYAVNGYRNAFFGETLNFDYKMLIYYWALVIIVFVIGYSTFKKCKKHFADVL